MKRLEKAKSNGNSSAGPGKTVIIIAAAVILIIALVVAFSQWPAPEGTNNAPAAQGQSPPETSPVQQQSAPQTTAPQPPAPQPTNCEAAGGEIAPWSDCSTVNVIQGDFNLRQNQVCCAKGLH